MRNRSLFPLLVLSLVASARPAIGQPAVSGAGEGGGNAFVCTALSESIEQKARELNSRRLNEFLFEAAEKGCLDVVAELIDAGALVKARDRSGNIALHHAASGGHVEIMELLLQKGSNIEQPNLAGSTPLLRAVTGNRRKAVEFLLQAGAATGLVSRNGATPLGAAAYHGNDRIVRLLIEHGADPIEADGTGKGPIVYAAARGYLSIVKMLLEHGVDVDHRYAHRLTALMWAAGHTNDTPESDGMKMVELLVERGADLEAEDDRGWTPVMTSASRGHSAIVRLLKQRGADLAHKARDGRMAIDLAADETVKKALSE